MTGDVRTGEFRDLVVTEDMTIQGSVDGVAVRSGATLVIQGNLAGHLEVDADAIISVQGNFAPSAVRNEGTVAVAGNCGLGSIRRTGMGRFLVSPGTLIDGSVLRPDGSEVRLSGGQHTLNVDAGQFCIWSDDDGRFLPT